MSEGGVLGTDATDGPAQMLDRDRSKESGHIGSKEVHERLDRFIAQPWTKPAFQ
jgi:hypothetical protein